MSKNFGNECWEINYQNGRYNKYPYDEVVSFILKNYKTKSTILDLGCGGGNNSLFCINEGHKVIAVDGSKTSLDLTKKLCSNSDNLICLHNNLNNLEVNDNSIDCIIDRQSMGHNSRDVIVEIIDELYRVLEIGGKIQSFIFSDNHPSLKTNKYNGKDNCFEFDDGVFSKSGFIYFTNKDDIKKLFYKFKIQDIKVHTVQSIENDFGYEYYTIEVIKE
jgi:ubiquinone/menaquinone biosynthesis C-methylase UbiE